MDLFYDIILPYGLTAVIAGFIGWVVGYAMAHAEGKK